MILEVAHPVKCTRCVRTERDYSASILEWLFNPTHICFDPFRCGLSKREPTEVTCHVFAFGGYVMSSTSIAAKSIIDSGPLRVQGLCCFISGTLPRERSMYVLQL